MKQTEEFKNNPEVAAALAKVLEQLEANSVIQEYRQIAEKVAQHSGLVDLTEEIKKEQKNAVQFAHYDKPIAEKAAIKRADELTAEFDQHPLVIRYREKLVEANDLLQHITNKFERDFNDQLAAKLAAVEKLAKERQ